MNAKFIFRRHPVLTIALGLATSFAIARICCANPPTDVRADNSQPVTAAPSSTVPAPEESLDVRYARAQLALAKLDLKRAESWNRQVPGVITKRVFEYLRQHIEIDEKRLQNAIDPNAVGIHEIYVRTAQLVADLARTDVARKQRLHQELGSDDSKIELDRALAWAEAAKLNLERTIIERDSIDTIGHLQWQIEELRNQILELNVKFEDVISGE